MDDDFQIYEVPSDSVQENYSHGEEYSPFFITEENPNFSHEDRASQTDLIHAFHTPSPPNGENILQSFPDFDHPSGSQSLFPHELTLPHHLSQQNAIPVQSTSHSYGQAHSTITFHRDGAFLGTPLNAYVPVTPTSIAQQRSQTPAAGYSPSLHAPAPSSRSRSRGGLRPIAPRPIGTRQPSRARSRTRRARQGHNQSPSTPTPAPTSAPAPLLDADHVGRGRLYRPRSTLALGVLGHLDRLIGECEAMRDSVRSAFGEADTLGEGEVERWRMESRAANGAVVGLDEPLQRLPVVDGSSNCVVVPLTAREIGWLDHQSMDELLAMYDIPHSAGVLLFEKMVLYMRFIGANRILMKAVLG